MLSASRWTRIFTHSLALLLGVGLALGAMPIWRGVVMSYHQERYGQLVAQCDGAMRDHFQARQSADIQQSAQAMAAVQSAELGLTICQDYDLYQKRLQQWGLRESELSQMRLRAIEAHASDLRDIVEIHEIRY